VRISAYGKEVMHANSPSSQEHTWLWILGNLMETGPHVTDNGMIKDI